MIIEIIDAQVIKIAEVLKANGLTANYKKMTDEQIVKQFIDTTCSRMINARAEKLATVTAIKNVEKIDSVIRR